MQESNFQQEITKSIKYLFPKGHYYKIPDPSTFETATIKRPYDCYYYQNPFLWVMELKQMKVCESYPFDRIEEHQIDGLKKSADAGGRGLVLINYRFFVTTKQKKKFGFIKSKHNFVIAFDVDTFIFLRAGIKSRGIQSFPIEDIIKFYHGKSGMKGVYIIIWEKFKNQFVWRMDKLINKENIKEEEGLFI